MAKKNDDGSRFVELKLEVIGTPEEVWRAIATGHGISTWFAPTKVDEREGGEVHFDLAPGIESTGKVTCWEPFRKFAYEDANWNGAAPPLGTEFNVEAIDGGKCIVRLVQSLFTDSDEWDDQLDGFESGWSAFLPILRAVLAYFRTETSIPLRLVGTSSDSESQTWEWIQNELGLADLMIGQAVNTSTPDGTSLFGEVLGLGTPKSPHQVLLRTDQPGPGLIYLGAHDIGPCVFVVVCVLSCGEQASVLAANAQQRWQQWIDERFPAAPTS